MLRIIRIAFFISLDRTLLLRRGLQGVACRRLFETCGLSSIEALPMGSLYDQISRDPCLVLSVPLSVESGQVPLLFQHHRMDQSEP